MSEFGSSHWQTGRQPYCRVGPMMFKIYESVIDDLSFRVYSGLIVLITANWNN